MLEASKTTEAHTSAVVTELPLQPASWDIWDKKYRLKTKTGEVIDHTVDNTLQRVATALASVENPDVREHWNERFLWALRQGAVPAGRILSNAGASQHKAKTTTINCTVSENLHDSMQSILERAVDAGITLKSGAGIGYCFSTLRPRGAYVSGAGASTSGPLSFMDIFDKVCATVASAGGRRGAQMGTFDIAHPDVADFIRAKREAGRLRQFNLSLLITKGFIDAVRKDAIWPLVFPVMGSEKGEIDFSDPTQVIWRDWPVTEDDYTVNDRGEVACKVYKTIPARKLWNLVMSSTYDYAEPGFLLIDEANDMNNNWWCETFIASNPCGEQVLPPNGACNLGSINLTRFVLDPFTSEARFDFERFGEVVAVFTRMLDNVVEINGLPLEAQRREIFNKRRHGMGYLGLGSTLAMLGHAYGSPESLQFTESVTRAMAVEGWRQGVLLAREKGPAPLLMETFLVTASMLRKRPEMIRDGWKEGDTIQGRVLHAKYSRYMQRLASVEPDLVRDLETYGSRFTHHTSIAPTGTIALSLGNNASNGIEPSFAHLYSRNVIREGRKTKEKVDVMSYELLAYRELVDPDATPETLPPCFSTADTITPHQHIDVQAAAQQWLDASVSKTCNVPTDIAFEDFSDLYLYAADKGLKGCTTFRFNPEAFQGVLVREKDLANTEYVFELEDGSQVRAKGNEEIEYEGETHSAANLYDALSEGYYGRL